MRILYLDAFSGLSGDMTVATLLDLGVSLAEIERTLGRLRVAGCRVGQETITRSGIRALRFIVDAEPGGAHRTLPDVLELLAEADLQPRVRETAGRIFRRLAEAEGRVHGVPPEAVHFHEVGAVDSVVDIVATAAGLAALGVEKLYVSPLPLGQGRVSTCHGTMPVPAPAVIELLRGLPVRLGDGEGEMVTPTGAAIVAALAERAQLPALEIERVGYGAGTREWSDRPNLLRGILARPAAPAIKDEVGVLEANIDDLNPEIYEHVIERLLDAGARDVFLVPVQMKKGRPGIWLTVLADPADEARLAAVLFSETSTLGLRRSRRERVVLPRESREVQTPYGAARVKVARAPDGTENVSPEYEECRRLAMAAAVPLKQVYGAVLRAYWSGGRSG